MESISPSASTGGVSPSELALELLNHCLRGNDAPRELLHELLRSATSADPEIAAAGSHALFRIVVERLSDLFDPALCDAYTRLFAEAIEWVIPELRAADLIDRYARVRRTPKFRGRDPKRVVVLSRVTLGADVAVTSVILDAVKRRFPRAEIALAGGVKAAQLFAADDRIRPAPVGYGRSGTLRDRLQVWRDLEALADDPDTIVADPDSRLTQLGLMPICDERRYFFFESRAYGGYDHEPLAELAARWAAATFGVDDARPYFAALPAPVLQEPGITISFGVGENQDKRIGGSFERDVIAHAAGVGPPVIVDTGSGGEERDRVERAIWDAGSATRVSAFQGAFSEFAAMIAASRLYIGYDSAGHHAAAAAGTPLVSIFAGAVSDRMFARWQPTGAGPKTVIRVSSSNAGRVAGLAKQAMEELLN